MGGAVSIVVREPLGQVKCYEAWTGGIGGICHCNRLYDDDPRLTEWLDSWYKGPTGDVSPDGYGLVLIDRMNKVILSCQGYSHVNAINGASILNEFNGVVIRMGEDDDDRGSALNFIELFLGGRVKHVEIYDREKNEMVKHDISHCKTPQEIIDMFKDDDSVHFWNVVIDTDPYTVENFEESVEGLLALKQRVLDLGFKLTDVEEGYWKAYIDDRVEWEEEDNL